MNGCRPDAFVQKVRRARKEHVCCECGKDICPGEKYQVSSGVWDGEPDRYKQCLHCAAVMDFCDDLHRYLRQHGREFKFVNMDDDDSPLFGYVWRWFCDVYEHYGRGSFPITPPVGSPAFELIEHQKMG
jgi:hypothetical protein